MLRQFKALYSTGDDVLVVSNAAFVDAPTAETHARTTAVRLGFMSILREEKGFIRAIETLGAVRNLGLQATLTVAGRIADDAALAALRRAKAEFGNAFAYAGEVTGEAKARFLANIDYLLFPSLYEHETQSLVVSEALSAGVPVAACDHRFVSELIGEGGIALPASETFAEPCARWIAATERDATLYASLRERAKKQFETNKAKSNGQIGRLVGWLLERQATQQATASAAVAQSGEK
jgi:glycosyltransferase involved in cell wall biosynthesis